MVTLTIAEIYELALYSGLTCEKPDDDMAGTNITVDVSDVHDEGGYGIYHGSRAYFTDYPEEGAMPLGDLPKE